MLLAFSRTSYLCYVFSSQISRVYVLSPETLIPPPSFARINYPFSATVHFSHSRDSPVEPDFSHLAKLCARLAEPGAPAISKVTIHGGGLGGRTFALLVESSGFEHLSFELTIEPHLLYPCLVLCFELPLDTVRELAMGGSTTCES